jgi:hypothetical protein
MQNIRTMSLGYGAIEDGSGTVSRTVRTGNDTVRIRNLVDCTSATYASFTAAVDGDINGVSITNGLFNDLREQWNIINDAASCCRPDCLTAV